MLPNLNLRVLVERGKPNKPTQKPIRRNNNKFFAFLSVEEGEGPLLLPIPYEDSRSKAETIDNDNIGEETVLMTQQDKKVETIDSDNIGEETILMNRLDKKVQTIDSDNIGEETVLMTQLDKKVESLDFTPNKDVDKENVPTKDKQVEKTPQS